MVPYYFYRCHNAVCQMYWNWQANRMRKKADAIIATATVLDKDALKELAQITTRSRHCKALIEIRKQDFDKIKRAYPKIWEEKWWFGGGPYPRHVCELQFERTQQNGNGK